MIGIALMLAFLPRVFDLLRVDSPASVRCLNFLLYGLCGFAILLLVRKQWRIYHFATYRKLLKRIQVRKSRPFTISGR